MTHSFPTRRSSDLRVPLKPALRPRPPSFNLAIRQAQGKSTRHFIDQPHHLGGQPPVTQLRQLELHPVTAFNPAPGIGRKRGCVDENVPGAEIGRSEEHTSELQSLMRISYAVFCLKKKKKIHKQNKIYTTHKEE